MQEVGGREVKCDLRSEQKMVLLGGTGDTGKCVLRCHWLFCFRWTPCLSTAPLGVTEVTLQTSSPRFSGQLFQVGQPVETLPGGWRGARRERLGYFPPLLLCSGTCSTLGGCFASGSLPHQASVLSAFPALAWQPWTWLWRHHILCCFSSHGVTLASAAVTLVLPSCLPL